MINDNTINYPITPIKILTIREKENVVFPQVVYDSSWIIIHI